MSRETVADYAAADAGIRLDLGMAASEVGSCVHAVRFGVSRAGRRLCHGRTPADLRGVSRGGFTLLLPDCYGWAMLDQETGAGRTQMSKILNKIRGLMVGRVGIEPTTKRYKSRRGCSPGLKHALCGTSQAVDLMTYIEGSASARRGADEGRRVPHCTEFALSHQRSVVAPSRLLTRVKSSSAPKSSS